MIAVTPALHLLVALSMTVPADPRACAADDLKCSASAFTAAALRATSDEERVEYLYFANRAYLGLSEDPLNGPPSSRDLCHAKRLIEQALALPITDLRGRVVESRRETLARLAEHRVQCKRPKPGKQNNPPLALTDAAPTDANATEKPPASNATPPPDTPVRTIATEPAPARSPQRPVPDTSASPVGPVDKPAVRTVNEWLARPGQPSDHAPGRRLLITGGVSMAAGLVLTGVSAYTGARALAARRMGHENMQLDPTPANLLRNTRLEDEYRRLGPAAIVTGVAGGVAIVAAVVMLCIGARRKTRATDSEPILMPVRTGLLFTLKF